MKLFFATPVFFISLFSIHSSAAPVTFTFSPSASAEFLELWSGEASAIDARCSIWVDRPMGKQIARASRRNAITCQSSASAQQQKISLGDSEVEQWGTSLEKYSFMVKGTFTDKLLPLFMKKLTEQSENGNKAGSNWSKMVMCGPDGATCDADYFLDVDATADSAAQIVCHQTTNLIRAPQKIVADAATASRADYYEYMIQKQIENGDRVVSETHCTFIH